MYGENFTSIAMSGRSPDMMDVYYLTELLNDRSELNANPGRFRHVERILDQEIVNVRNRLFDCNFGVNMQLPEPVGEPGLYRKKLYMPESGRHYNYVGRLLGPRGKTLKSIEQDTGCKIMIRGIGSTRPNSPPMYPQHFGPGGDVGSGFGFMSSPSAQQFNQALYASPSPARYNPAGGNFFHGKPTDTDDTDRLHVLIQCEDTFNRAEIRIGTAVSLIEHLFAPVDEAHDELKKKQLLELSLIKGTLKLTPPPTSQIQQQFMTPPPSYIQQQFMTPRKSTFFASL